MAASGNSASGGGKNIRAGRAFVEMSVDDSKLRTGLQRAKAMMQSFGTKMAAVGAGIGAAGGAILGPLVGIFHKTIETYDGIQKAADRLGTSTEIISALGYAASQSGSNLEGLENAAKHMQKNLSAAAEDGGEAADALSRIGLSAEEVLALPLDQQLMAIAEGLQGVDNPADKAALAMKLLGKSGADMLPMLKDGADGIRDLMEEAKKVGAVVSGGDAKNSEKIGDSIDKVWTAVKNTIMRVGAAFLPTVDSIETFADVLVGAIQSVRAWIDDNKVLIRTIAIIGASLAVAGSIITTVGIGIAVLGTAIGGIMTAVSALGSVFAAVFSPVGLTILAIIGVVVALGAAIGGLIYAFVEFTDIGQTLWSTFKETFGEIWETFKTTFGGIVEAIKGGDLRLAWDIAMKGMRIVWNDLIIGLKTAWNDFMKWYFTKTMDGIKSVAKAFGLDELLGRVTGAEEEGKKKFLDMMGFDLSADIAHRDQLKRELEAMANQAKALNAKDSETPLSKYQRVDVNRYLARLGENARGLFQAPNLNQALGVGTKVKTDKAIQDTAKNTEKIVKNTANIEAATFK